MKFYLTDSDSLFSYWIKRHSGKDFSHVGIELSWLPGQIIDTTWKYKGVRPWSIDRWSTLDGRRIVREVTIQTGDVSGGKWLVEQYGKPYDKSAILGMATLNSFEEDDAWYCFELATMAAVKGGKAMREPVRRIDASAFAHILDGWTR